MKKNLPTKIKLILSFGFPLTIALLGGIFTSAAVNGWYQTLVRPSFAPPNWIFGPIWTLLYLSIGLATYLFWDTKIPSNAQNKHLKKLPGFIFLYLQLIFNLAWSIIFFLLHSPQAALYEIILLIGLVVLNIFYFAKINVKSGLILIPYLIWLLFASYLNWAFFILN